jgi:hypothetical protein
MSCLTRTIRYNFVTGERTVISEVPSDHEDHSEELLLKYFTKTCMEEFKRTQRENTRMDDKFSVEG